MQFKDYLKTNQSYWYWIIMAITLAATIVILTPINFPILSFTRNILGIIFVWLLPGYTLSKIFFPKKTQFKLTENNLDLIERIILSLGLSAALIPMIGLLLSYMHADSGLITTTVSLLALSTCFATIAIAKEYRNNKRHLDHNKHFR